MFRFKAFLILTLVLLTAIPCFADPPFELPPQVELNKIRSAEMFTSQGKMIFELYPDKAPWHVANFKYLADKGFYQGLRFDSFYADYMIQGGNPKGSGKSIARYTLPPEFSSLHHEFGTLGMARRADDIDVDHERASSATQFQIILADAPHLDGKYTVFGKLVRGADVLTRLREGDTIEDIKVFVRR